MKLPVSVIILSYNEELNIESCLQNIADWADEIIIVDSFSTDKTLEIAKNYTNKIVQRKFTNQAEQFNWALDNLEIKNDWILRLDADEYLTEELKKEISGLSVSEDGAVSQRQSGVSGYYIKRRVYFLGRWIKHGGYYPLWFLRLFKKGKGRCENREMDEHIILLEGSAEKLRNDFVDDNKKSLSWWTEKHNNYASREAEEALKRKYGGEVKKILYYHLPPFLRPFLYFIYRYFFQLGFLDGRRGLIFHFLQGYWYRFLIDAKIHEYRKNKVGSPVK